jgi:hypothetical protein
MIKNWNLFKESVDEESKIHQICKRYNIENYTINTDGSIDVDGDVDLSNKSLIKIPIKFRKVSGNFHCYHNKLTSLIGCPEYVGDNFLCHDNKLTSLEGISKYTNYLNCDYNEIWSFKGIPDSFRGYLSCYWNPISKIYKLFNSSGDIEFFNECDIIREPETPHSLPIVVLERLNFFLETIGKSPVERVDGYINI